jgi:hypothetical protein
MVKSATKKEVAKSSSKKAGAKTPVPDTKTPPTSGKKNRNATPASKGKGKAGAAAAAAATPNNNNTDDDPDAEAATPAPMVSLPFSDPPLGDVDEFVKDHPLYKHMVVTVYQIVRDLHIKQEVTNIEIVDGKRWGRKQYFIKAASRMDRKQRLMVPVGLDEELDLAWIHGLCSETEKQGIVLYICLHTPETIVYETLHTELP